jgi:hypothetical protein
MATEIIGRVDDAGSESEATLKLDGDNGDITAGGHTSNGDLRILDGDGKGRIHLGLEQLTGRGNVKTSAWSMSISEPDGDKMFRVGPFGDLTLGGKGNDGDLMILDEKGKVRLRMGGDEHRLSISDDQNVARVVVQTGDPSKPAGRFVVGDPKASAPALEARSEGTGDGVSGRTSAEGRSGVYGSTDNRDGFGVFGRNEAGESFGSMGSVQWRDWIDDSLTIGVAGFAKGAKSAGVEGRADKVGVLGLGGLIGVWGLLDAEQGNAGEFWGPVGVYGDLFVSGDKQFIIDHPLDPADSYLVHSCVESAERTNVYNGTAELDEEGEAWVELPDWFEALNGDFRYQLTPTGAPAPELHVAQEISENRFKIAGGPKGIKVSWQVSGTRHDAFARAHPMRVELKKQEPERGGFLAAREHGQPEESGILRKRLERIRTSDATG